MGSRASRRRRCTIIACIAAMLTVGFTTDSPELPDGGTLASEEPTRWVIGFHQFPDGLNTGGQYLGSPIVNADEGLRFVTVETGNPQTLVSTALSDPNVRYAEQAQAGHIIDPQLIPPDPELLPAPDVTLPQGEHGDVGDPAFTPNDPHFSTNQYGPQQIRAPEAWDYTRGSTQSAVCIVDSGIRRSHEDIGTGRWLGWRDFVNGNSTPYDDHGHGTHVAGIAAATVNNSVGIAGVGNVGIYGVKVLESSGIVWSDVAAQGIQWCANNTIQRTVINISLGWTSQPPSHLANAVQYAYSQGKLLVASSGNGSCTNCITWPARYSEVIAVGCTTSSRASCSFTSKGTQMEAVAPGNSILSTYHLNNSSYVYMSGTSMSAPHVAGALALAWSHNTGLAHTTLRSRLQLTAVDLGTSGHDSTFGHGLVDAKCLVSATPHRARSLVANAGPGAGQIRLTWSAPIYDCRAAISEYRVYRATSSGGSYSLVGTVGGSVRTFTDSGLGNGVWRYYRVRAVNSRGASLDSNTASARTFTTPSAPTSVVAVPGTSINQIRVSWQPPSNNGGTSVTGYRVYRSGTATGTFSQVASVGSSARSWTDSNTAIGTTYYYRVRAVNLVGVGAWSSTTCSKPFPSLAGVC